MKHKKRRPGKRMVSLLLSLSMTLSGMPVTAEELHTETAIETEAVEIHTEAAADTEVPLPEVTETPVQEVTEAPVQESTETPVQEATEAALVQTEAPQQEPETETPVQTEAVTEALQQTETLIPEQDVVEEPETDAAEEYETSTDETEQMTESDTAKTIRVQIGEVGYETLAEALAAAQSGDVITLVEDIATDDDLTIPAGVTVLIPEGRSFTISKETKLTGEAGATLTSQGTLLLASGEDCDVDIYHGSGTIRVGTDPDEEAGIFYDEIHYEQNKELYFRCKICGSTEQKKDLDFRQELLKRLCSEGLEGKNEEEKEAIDALADQSLAEIEFIIEETATLKIQENTVLDLSGLSAEHISIHGTLINYGVLYLSAAAPGTIPVQGTILNYGTAEGLEEEQETEESIEDTEEMTEGATEEADVSEAVDAVRAMIDALPEASELESMGEEELDEVYMQAQEAYDAYGALTEEEQTELAEAFEKLVGIMEWFNGGVEETFTTVSSGSYYGFTVTGSMLREGSLYYQIGTIEITDWKYDSGKRTMTVNGSVGYYYMNSTGTPNATQKINCSFKIGNDCSKSISSTATYNNTRVVTLTLLRNPGHFLTEATFCGDDMHTGTCLICGQEVVEYCEYTGKCNTTSACKLCGVEGQSTSNHTNKNKTNGFYICCNEPEAAQVDYSSGGYKIENAGQLYWFAKQLKSCSSLSAVLAADIDMGDVPEGVTWSRIESFDGVFDGNGHEIKNLNQAGGDNSFIKKMNGTVKNLTFRNASAFQNESGGAGIIAAENNGTISKCLCIDSAIQYGAYNNLGIIAGSNSGIIEYCRVMGCTATRRFGGAESQSLGGIVDTNSGTVQDCYLYDCKFTNGAVRASVVCTNTGTVSNCYYYIASSSVTETAGSTAVTTAQFQSGEVTYKLNNGITDGTQIWYQTCGEGYPVFEGKTVYYGYVCGSKSYEKIYSNEGECIVPNASYSHKWNNGICTVCGIYQTPEGDGTEDNPYQITNAYNLLWLAEVVSDGYRETEKNNSACAVLCNDIDAGEITQMVIGTADIPYAGVFNGNGYTLTLGLDGEANVAPFGYTEGATIKNLTIAGTIEASGQFASGFISCVKGDTTIENCISSVTISSSVNGDGTHGGFVAKVDSGKLSIENSAFIGSMVGSNTKNCGGFVGWVSAASLDVKNSYVAAAFSTNSSGCNTFARKGSSAVVGFENCYYLNKYGSDSDYAGTAQKSEDDFAGGEVAYLLNGSVNAFNRWYQNIDRGTKDSFPVLNSAHGKIYYGYADCETETQTYSNFTRKELQGHEKNENATWNCITSVQCTVCGYDFGVNPEIHASEDTYYIKGNDQTHILKHSCCDAVVKEEEHTGEKVYINENSRNFYKYHQQKWSCCEVIIIEQEEHNWIYSADDETDTITRTCEQCGLTETTKMVVNGDGKTYDGKALSVSFNRTGYSNSYYDYWITDSNVTCCCDGGCKTAGTHTFTMSYGDVSVSKTVTIEKREISISNIQGYYKVYDGTNEVSARKVEFSNVIDGDEVSFDKDTLKVLTPGADVGNYEYGSASGVLLTGADAGNYTIAESFEEVKLSHEYSMEYFYITLRQVWIRPQDQQVQGDAEIDQSQYTVDGLPDGFEIEGIVLDEKNGYIWVNTDGIKIKKDGEDVTANFDISATQSANLSRVCEGHTFGSDGFCSSGMCDAYQPAVQNDNGTPDETWDDYYEIWNAGQLYWFAKQVNDYSKTDIHGKLMADITVNADPMADDAREWIPIANQSWSGYYGNFYGNGHTVSGLYCKAENGYVGFFGTLGYYTLTDLHIANSYFEGSYAGAIAGYSNGATISHCSVASTVTVVGSQCTGGIVGSSSYETIANCYSLATVSGGTWGGLVGSNTATIENCHTNAMQPVGYMSSYGGSMTNVYYAEDTRDYTIKDEDGYIQTKPTYSGAYEATDEQFRSGEIAYRLQSGVTGEVTGYDEEGNPISDDAPQIWYQTIGTDSYPKFSGSIVYCGYNSCDENKEAIYTNDSTIPSERPAHKFNENGFCTLCKHYEPAKLNSDGDYEISNAGQLYWFAAVVNSGYDDTKQNSAACGKLTGNITVNENVIVNGTLNSNTEAFREWTPIGSESNPYTGTFDGGNCTISGLYYNTNTNYGGMFGYIQGTTVQNIVVTDSYIKNKNYVGGIAGYLQKDQGNQAEISNCSFSGVVSGNMDVGGIVGSNIEGTITSCYNAGTISGDSNIGGIAGDNSGTVRDCYNTSNVSCTRDGSGNVGGLAGNNSGTVTNCYNIGKITGQNFGSVAGNNSGTGTNCYYLEGSASKGIGNGTDDTTVKTVDKFTSGEVAWLLNSERSEGTEENPLVWYQSLGENGDENPKFAGKTVYSYKVCKETFYSNTQQENIDHLYDNGFCTICDSYEPAKLNDGFYEIGNAGQLYWFANLANNNDQKANGKLIASVRINDSVIVDDALNSDTEVVKGFRTWTPIGNPEKSYEGIFDGNGKTISGLYCSSENNYVGLFGYIYNTTVKNITVKDSYFKGADYVGGIVGNLWCPDTATLSGCSFGGVVSGTNKVGGVLGCCDGKGNVSTCSNSGKITAKSYVGGVVGCNYSAAIESCSNTGTITGTSSRIGGVVGNSNPGSVSKSYNSGTVKGDSDVGGVVGYDNDGKTTDCYNTGSVNGTRNVGGISGTCSSAVSNCYDIGSISGEKMSGRIIGKYDGGSVDNCYYFSDSASYKGIGEKDDYQGMTEYKTKAQFASGEVAYLLNGSRSEGTEKNPFIWYQTIGTDESPKFTGEIVYCKGADGDSDTENNYYNKIAAVTITWTDMNFTYSRGTWDTETMTWQGGSWSAGEGCGMVTVENTGTVDVLAEVDVDENVAMYLGILGASISFTENSTGKTDSKLNLAAGMKETVTVSLSGDDPGEFDESPIGAITIRLSTEEGGD